MESMALNRFIEILDSIISQHNSSLELFRQNWRTELAAFQGSDETKRLLCEVEEVVDDALTHMPGKKGQPTEVDWNLWANESDALAVVVARESLALGIDSMAYMTAQKQLPTLRNVKPPYLNQKVSQSVQVWLRNVSKKAD